ncbi:rod shape-determining protein MreB [Lachnotalea glycerini]|uniref:Cell shape-determining protein MreB n=1 Tax=Lachnotalea glycerini TaxID=1763509 RepID=A0A255I354_9FIRM|nr:rod shape-determining protein [Lachnotalea glycerini]PXV95527.1 rod shape-determining protein MreB [Lachnotalea glycerini]RDY32845.1 rod shape-determining protein [Lachnotalea glycerini]
MASNIFGIDLGTSNIKIYNEDEDTILNEKNIIAILNKNVFFAVGDEAFEMYEKAPANIKVTYPMSNGVIADIKNMQLILKKMLEKAAKSNLKNGDYYIAVPTDITEVEKRAFYDLVENANVKAKRVYITEKAIVDALGLGIDVTSSQGIMIVNIGADTTEISIVSLGGIVVSRLIKIGGNKFDEAIINYIKRNFNFIIGDKTAEVIKKELANALAPDESSAGVYGRDIVTGLPSELAISSKVIYESISEPLHSIVDAVKVILERTPPELGADIIRAGIYLTGGSSNIQGLDKMFHKETGLKVNICDKPAESVARGFSKMINEAEYRKLAYTTKNLNNVR